MRQSGLLLDDNRDVSEACVTRPLVEIAIIRKPQNRNKALNNLYIFQT